MTLSPRWVRLVFLALNGILFFWVAWEARNFPERARIFPQSIALLGFSVIVVKMALLLRKDDVDADVAASEGLEDGSATTIGEEWRRAVPFLGAFTAYAVGIAIVGFLPASFLFVLLFLRLFDRMGWMKSAASAILFTLVLLFLAYSMGLELPEGWLGLGI